MQKIKNILSFALSKKPPESKPRQLEIQTPQLRRFSEPNILGEKEINEPRLIEASQKSDLSSESLPNLFERSVKVLFPKTGNLSDHEAKLREVLSNLSNIINVIR
jgi:hypothetical protein